MPTFVVPMPYKGVHRLLPRSEQPADTCWDALNVLPFDRYGRRRIAQRPGSGRLFEDITGLIAEGGSTTTIVDVGLADAGYTSESIFGTVTFTSGPLNGTTALISSYSPDTDTITLAQTLSTAVTAGTTYSISRTLGPASQSIRALKQVSTIPSSPTVTADTLVFGEDFSAYPNGTLVRDVGGVRDARLRMIGLDSPLSWDTVWASDTRANQGSIQSGAIYCSGSGGTYSALVPWSVRTAPAVGSTYRIEISFTVRTSSAEPSYISVFTRTANDPTTSRASVNVYAERNTAGVCSVKLRVLNSGGGTVSTPGSFTYGGTNYLSTGRHTMVVTVNGNLYSVYVDDVFLFSATVTDYATQSGVGFGYTYSTLSDSTAANGYVTKFMVYTGSPSSVSAENKLLAVSGRSVHVGRPHVGMPIAGGGLDVLLGTFRPEVALIDREAYIVDGSAPIYRVDLAANTMLTYTASAGTAPTNCTLAAAWRGRLVVASPTGAPQNFFFARVGNPFDWDYSQTDPAAAFAGNVGTIGKIGEPITALIPFTNDVLVIGTTRSIYAVNGDPADGGTIDLITSNTGIVGPRAWAVDPSGTVWFVGAGGLYRMSPTPNSSPENMSYLVYPQFFSAISSRSWYIDLQWDNQRHGLWVFATRVSSADSIHLFYDARNGGYWPMQWPINHGPMSALAYYGDDPDRRYLLLGGRNGRIYAQSDRTRRDEVSTPISCHVEIGPMQLNPNGDSTIHRIDLDMGEVAPPDDSTVWNLDLDLLGGKTAYAVTEGTERYLYTYRFVNDGRGLTRVARVRGGWHTIKLRNADDGDYFSLEKMSVDWTPAGRQR